MPAQKSTRWRSFAVRLLVLLALGAVTTVAVSWTTVILEPDPSAPTCYLHDDGAFIWSMEERGNPRQRIRDWIIAWRWREGVSQELRADFLEEEMSRKSRFKQMPLPPSMFESRREQLNALNARWGAPRIRDRPGVADWDNRVEDFGRFEFIEHESGWPAFAMRSTRLFTGGNWVTDGAFVTRRKRGEPLDLPYHILPLGFLLNSALVTALLYLPRITTSALRSNRKRRGRCPACATTLDENAPTGCAACGWKPTA